MTISEPAGRHPPCSSSVVFPSQISADSNYTAVEEPLHPTDTCNVVIFGESGAGKSSLVNLIAGTNKAATSSDARGCTTGTKAYDIWIQNGTLKVNLFDTAGLDEGPQAAVPDEEARRILKRLIHALMEQGSIHLIIYCVRGERVIRTLRRNYEFIRSQAKSKVPIVLVVTSLESYEPDMEKWWRLNERTIVELGMSFAGHACVTTAMTTQSKVTERGRNQSYDDICKLIEQCRLSNEAVVRTAPSRGTIGHIVSKLAASNKHTNIISITKHTNIVLFGQAGAGKSSLVNLIAGKDVASTSHGLKSCTLHWQEYPIQFDRESYKVFDTIGLQEPQLDIPQYLDAVENAYKLTQNLERQGGVDLLLFCMRAGRLTDTLQSNYRLFHEFFCDRKVPVVVVITHLEDEVGEMDAWWKNNENIFREREVDVAGHACITAIQGDCSDRYEESRATIHNLIKEFTADGQKVTLIRGDDAFVSFMRKSKELLVRKKKSRFSKDAVVSRLTKRCGLPTDVAKRLVDRIKW
ncbi:P-loop containing nucleoside triphosphate hydrolase protein [Suillus spraguei]|nr:P-loop containing nucleoside triphosphate hydrolase protein [Suillus spraguei]